jgi:hypothetical protein
VNRRSGIRGSADGRRARGSSGRRACWLALACCLALGGSTATLLAQPPGEPASEYPPGRPLGAPATFARPDRATLVLPAETEILAEPSPLARALLRLDVEVEVEVLEERDGWMRVRIGELKGWVATGAVAGFGSGAAVGLSGERLDLQAARLERARALMSGASMRRTAALVWWTDLHPNLDLSARLAELFACFSATYERRYGLDRIAYPDRDVVAVFTRQEDYRRFVDGETGVADLVSGGFSAIGFAAFYAGDRPGDDVAAIAAHELTHLENRRRLALELPPWLEEGLAEDMGLLAAAGRGCPDSGWPRISRREWRTGGGRGRTLNVLETTSGKLRSLSCTVAGWRSSPVDLRELAGMSWGSFSAPAGRASRYAAAALLVRFLLDGDPDGERRAEFRAFLGAGRDRGSFAWEELLGRLGADDDELAEALRAWAAVELVAYECV